jgi:peptidoglycan/LPS O-acetylase OafA/YrhL
VADDPTTDAPAPTRLGYRPALDGLRAVAIAAVVFDHAGLCARRGGFCVPDEGILGVDIFFVLSGFLITTLLLQERDRNGGISFRDFYVRRARRLLPALTALLAVALVAATASAVRNHDEWRFYRELLTTAYAYGFVTNIAVVWASSSVAFGMGHLWSLATEDQFYLLWPFILAVVARFRSSWALSILCLMLTGELAREIQLYHAGASSTRIGIAPDTRSAGIVVGCALAVLLKTRARSAIVETCRLCAPVAALALVWTLGAQLTDRDKFVGGTTVVAVVTAVLLAGVLDARSTVGKLLSLSPIVYLGRISYSLYLWHYPIFYSAHFAYGSELHRWAGIGISVVLAALSYHLVEAPFLRRRKPRLHFAGRPVRWWPGQSRAT